MMRKISIFGVALLLAATTTAAERVPGTNHFVGDEIPFVQGQGEPAAPSGYAWCLERKRAVMRTVNEQVKVRDETSYYESLPPQYETRNEQILVEPEQKKAILIRPAAYRDVSEQKLVEPATVEYRTIPAQYAWAEEEVEVVPERKERVFIPAQYEEYTERILVNPEQTVREDVPGCDKDGGKIDCYGSRVIPAKYQVVTKKRLIAPATTQDKVIPAEKKLMRVRKVVAPARVEEVKVAPKYDTIVKKVLETPAEYRYETIPAKYNTIQKKVAVSDEGKRLVRVPAKYETISRMEVVTPERLVWVLKDNRSIACPLEADRIDIRVEEEAPTRARASSGASAEDNANVDDLVKRYGRVPGTASGR